MITMRPSHDVRCERSMAKVGRCRCECGGNLHGVEATQQVLHRAHQRQFITDDEYADALERIRVRMEVAR